jgi:hypothetical protein
LSLSLSGGSALSWVLRQLQYDYDCDNDNDNDNDIEKDK